MISELFFLVLELQEVRYGITFVFGMLATNNLVAVPCGKNFEGENLQISQHFAECLIHA